MSNQTNSPLNFTSDTTSGNNVQTVKGYGSVISSNSNFLKSLFGQTQFSPFPGSPDSNGNPSGNNSTDFSQFEDTSVTTIVNWSTKKGSGSAYQLSYADFAYLKNLGVYPNNRLMIARRFMTPVGNDLLALDAQSPTTRPLSTLISWVPPDGDFIKITFGENWTDAAGSFETILNDMGKDLSLSSDNKSGMGNLGSLAAQGFNAVPLPGLTEKLQKDIMVKLGLMDPNNSDYELPIGDPNLIKEAKRRATVDKGSAGSGLKATININMKVEYEQKYIDGVDPTLVYMDIVSNILSFGTSNARFMFNQNFSTKAQSKLIGLISGNVNAFYSVLKDIVSSITSVLSDLAKQIQDQVTNIFNSTQKKASDPKSGPAPSIIQYLFESIGAIIGKYKVAIVGVINALTGSPSGYWHISVGNPRRPVFSSGDMYVKEVTLTMGPVLSWNDLPSSITAEFTMENTRSLGADELFAKFNNSMARAYKRLLDFNQTNVVVNKQNPDGSVSIDSSDTSQNNQTIITTPQGQSSVVSKQT